MINKNLVKVNASAGSGKTFTLTNRFVDLLFDSDAAPCESCKPVKNKVKFNFSELLAITFTNLAANQMKEKVIAKLKQYALKELSLKEAHCDTHEELEEKAKQAHAILARIFQQYGALNIRTIDSLLNQLVSIFSLEFGYPPQFETRFGSEEFIEELYTKLAEQSIFNENSCDANALNYSPVFDELCRNNFDNSKHANFMAKGILQKQIVKFISYCIKENTSLSAKELQELEQYYVFFQQRKEQISQALFDLAEEIKTNIKEQNITVSQKFITALETIQTGKYTTTYLKKESFADIVSAKNKGDITKVSALFLEMQETIKKFNLAVLMHKNYALILPVIRIAVFLLIALEAYERDKQCINTQKMPYMIASMFNEAIGTLQNAFLNQMKQENQLIPAAYCRLGTRLQHMLYDEFQDTSAAQWEALKDLSSEVLSKAGSVFFVGDVKQAIYGWRGGKAQLFTDAPKQLEHYGKSVSDNLPCNWRSAENIIAWNNSFFKNLTDNTKNSDIALLFSSAKDKKFSEKSITETRESVQENYQQVLQSIAQNRLPKVRDKGIVEVHSLRESDAFFDTAVLCLLPEIVQNLHKKYKKYSKIAILTVNNNQASLVSQVLLEHNIPVVSQGSLRLKEHPVIMEVIAFLRFLANPLDENALCQVLLSRHVLPQSFYENCPVQERFDFLASPREGFLFTAFRRKYPALWERYFQVLVDGANLLTAYDTLCEVYKRMGIMEQNQDAAVYLLRLKELAYLAEEKGLVDIHAFLDWWEESGEKENAPLPEGLNSVSVLTMHKSKGLEYEAVIIPWHNFKIAVPDDVCRFMVSFEGKLYPMYAKLEEKYGKPYYDAIADKIKECINLLYVAWTRAKQELHIFMPAKYMTAKNGTFYRFLEAFLERLKNEVQDLSFEKKADCVQKGEEYTPLVSEKIRYSSDYVFAEDADCLHAGEKSEPLVSEKMLLCLEYIFDLCSEEEKKKAEAYLSEEQKAKAALFLDEFKEEIKPKKTKKNQEENSEDDSEQEEAPASCVKIITDDISYAAKWLSRILYAEGENKQHRAEKNTQYTENLYEQKHSMDWLPQLRIFRSDLDELIGETGLSANKRGTIIHKSLEYLVFSGNVAEDCKRAAFEAMKFLPYGRFLGDTALEAKNIENQKLKTLYEKVQEPLQWFAGLKQPFGGAEFWFKYGYKEHSITNEKGELFRVDLLVEIPESKRHIYQNTAYIAVDYKTGYTEDVLPVPSNEKQILNYIDLLEKTTGKKTVGVLVYLDCKQCCVIEST